MLVEHEALPDVGDGGGGQKDFDANAVCFICEHPWMMHTQGSGISTQNKPFARGGTSDGTVPSNISAVATPATSAAAPVLAPKRPVTAFTGLSRLTTASVQEQRRASIQRSGSTPTKKRKSGPPRAFSDTPATLPLLDDFAPMVVDPVTITVGILPKVLDTSDHNDTLDLSPRYFWKSGDEIERVQHALQRANLIFTVDVNVNGPIVEAIDIAFKNHCESNRIDYVSPPQPASAPVTPNTAAWALTGPRGRSAGRTWVEDPKSLTRFTFTLQALRNIPFSYTPNNLGEVPRLRNLLGPIDCLFDPTTRLPDHVLTHKCFSRRVLHPILASLSTDSEPVCGPSCTPNINRDYQTAPRHLRVPSPDLYVVSDSDDDGVNFPEAEVLIERMVRDGLPPLLVPDDGTKSMRMDIPHAPPASKACYTSSPVVNIAQLSFCRFLLAPFGVSSGRRKPQPQPVSSVTPFIASPLLTAAMELTDTSNKSRSFLGDDAPLDLTLQHMPGSGVYSLAAWQDHILVPRELEPHVSITAYSVDEGARALIILCLWLFAGRPRGLKLKELLQEQFPSPRPTIDGATGGHIALFGLRVSIGPGIGRRPRNEVVAEAIKILLADRHFWTERETYQTLRLHPSRAPIPARSCVLKATGFVFLLHFLFIGAPLPVSPFLFSTIFDGRRTAAKFDIDFLTPFLSAGSLSFITKLGCIPLDKPLYASQCEDCIEYQYLLNIPEVDEEQDGVCGSVISFLTLGTVDIEHQPDFRALGDGFNVVVDAFGGQERPHHVLEWFATPCRELILAAFDRQIKAPTDVISHLEFTQTNPENDLWGENNEILGLITGFVTHYLTEPGHPIDPEHVIDALVDEDDNQADPLVRAKLFLAVLTGSMLLPVKPTWKVKCLIVHDWSEAYPTTDADGRDDFGPEVSVSFRTCFKTFTITNNARLRQILLSEKPVPGRDTEFGRFLHGQLLAIGYSGGPSADASMSGPSTRHSQRLNNEPLSPPPSLPSRSRRVQPPSNDLHPNEVLSNNGLRESSTDPTSFRSDPAPQNSGLVLHNQNDEESSVPLSAEDAAFVWRELHSSPEGYAPGSSPYPLAPISETAFDTSHPVSFKNTSLADLGLLSNAPGIMHSPRPLHPAPRTVSGSSSSFFLAPAFSSSVTSRPDSSFASASSTPMLEQPPASIDPGLPAAQTSPELHVESPDFYIAWSKTFIEVGGNYRTVVQPRTGLRHNPPQKFGLLMPPLSPK
ncbi:hypothetical protein B0H19DRAFT_1083208 [Mycena capillaripes]|nr:hypothetical protein B0H19DRAFT_1083208 [Mycena capillaripes]